MPVHFTVASHASNPVKLPLGNHTLTPDELLHNSWGIKARTTRSAELLQTSFVKRDDAFVWALNNGFVDTVTMAYSNHHHLILRPDDVWMAILSQFNFYVNAHAEELRSHFVQHKGKKELIVRAIGTRYTVDFGNLAHQMTDQIHNNLVDPDLKEWILPDFTTTTHNDTVISAVLMMATLKAYFSYKIELRCGIPSVTLEGEKSDWENILARLDKLNSFGAEPTAWAALLRPIVSRLVSAFDGAPDVDFWNRVCTYHPQGSGPTYLSGWITAFCVWTCDGKWQGPSLTPPQGTYTQLSGERDTLVLDGIGYPVIKEGDVPAGSCEVDVKVDDNGEIFECMMVSGHLAGAVEGEGRDGVRPLAEWFMFVKGKCLIKWICDWNLEQATQAQSQSQTTTEQLLADLHISYIQKLGQIYTMSILLRCATIMFSSQYITLITARSSLDFIKIFRQLERHAFRTAKDPGSWICMQMPVHFTVASHASNPVELPPGTHVTTPDELLHTSWGIQAKTTRSAEMLQTSFVKRHDASVCALNNGFVDTVTMAYSNHHHLILRPDDVWIAILSQFNFYNSVNAHAEELRSHFVQHEGKKELVVKSVGTRYTVDFGDLAHQMTDQIHNNVVDPDLKDWILPDFTTTTHNDTVISAVLMMATLKAYFSYTFELTCGIPSVTLEGEKADWENLLARLDKLDSFGAEPTAWAALLRPIVSRFVSAFNGAPDVDFWNRVCHYHPQGSGPTYLSGWITAFCVWTSAGEWQGLSLAHPQTPYVQLSGKMDTLVLDGIRYPVIKSGDVPAGFCEVDVKLVDNGEVFDCMMVSGHLAGAVEGEGRDGLRPLPAWFMFVKESCEDPEEVEMRKIMTDMEARFPLATKW
ncbi:hypothetical protein B0H34DRAFT_677611 [Crassisporium funariophilum]|nr:hypothetical protein B0H34DRAFT_677611 [Crassisporium funariophilum]